MTEPDNPDLVVGDDGLARPAWAAADPLLREYYDTEWGMPVRDERGVFERLSLEAFQSGLSWATILRKRPAFRDAFSGFDPNSKNPANPRKVYTAAYVPPAPAGGMFTNQAAAQPAAASAWSASARRRDWASRRASRPRSPTVSTPPNTFHRRPGAMNSRTMAAMIGTRCFMERPT